MATSDRDVVLIVDDVPTCANAIQRVLPPELRRRIASSARAAIAMLREPDARWALFLIDVNLGEGGTGFDVLDAACELHPGVVRAVVTGDDSAETNNLARARNADVLRKPLNRAAVAATVARITSQRFLRGEQARWLAELVVAASLSPTEHDVLARLVVGERRQDLPIRMNVAERTIRSHVAGILAKTGQASIKDVVAMVLRGPPWPPLRRARAT